MLVYVYAGFEILSFTGNAKETKFGIDISERVQKRIDTSTACNASFANQGKWFWFLFGLVF